MQSISKLCADYLRDISSKHSVKLKSGHAHELVAALFGYKSKAALLADTHSHVDNIAEAQFFVLTSSQFVNDRRKCLDGLPPDLPDTYTLGEEMFVKLIAEKELLFKVFPSWSHFTEALTTEYLCKQGVSILPKNFGYYEKAHRVFSKPLYEFKPEIENIDGGIKIITSNKYYCSSDIHFQSIDVTIMIKLQRIAGHVGYARPEISIIDTSNQLIGKSV